MTLRYSRGRSIHDARPEQRKVQDFAALIAALDSDRAPAKEGAGYVCGPLNGDGRRCAEGALPRRWIALDADRIRPDVLPALRMWFAGRFSGCAWPTHSSRPEAPRERILIELDRDATRDEALAIGRALAHDLWQEFGDAIALDDSTHRAEQPVFLPPHGVALARFMGDPLPVDAFVAAAPPTLPQQEAEPADAAVVAPGGRHKHLVRWAAQMNWRGIAPEAITLAVHAENARACSPPLPREEAEAIAADVIRRYASQHGRDQVGAHVALGSPVDIFREVVAPPLAPEHFPPLLADFATLQARAAGHDANGYLLAGLVAAAGVISDEVRLAVDPRTSWFESPRLWGLLQGPPGAAKTPAIRAVMGAHFELQRQLRKQHEEALKALAVDEPKPAPRLVFTNDATIEALSEILAATPRGVLAVSEELDSWLGQHDAYRGGQGSKDRGEWLRLFDGGPHQVDRIKRGSVFVQNWGVSLLGATTPAGMRRHAKDLPPDGLIQRFLVTMVRPAVEPDLSISAAEVRTAREAWEQRLLELHQLGACIVQMTPEARALMQERHAALRRECGAAAGLSEAFAGHLAKHPGLLARVALVHHCLANGCSAGEVLLDAGSVAGAIGILQRLARHALVMFDSLADRGGALPLARAAGASVVAMGIDVVQRRDLIHRCRAFRDAPETEQEAALRLLVDAAWLTPQDDARQYRGRPASYAVHPQVPELFAAQGQALRARRQAVRALLEE